MKTKLLITFLLSFALTGIQAQQNTDAAGGDVTSGTYQISYSIGQVSYVHDTSSTYYINEGVQQPYDITVGIPENNTITLSYTVYPNPTASTLNLKVENQSFDNLSFQLYDIGGKLILNQKIKSSETSIQMENFAKANYLLKVTDNNIEVQTFKIIKY